MAVNRKASDEQLLESYARLGSVWKVGLEFGMCGQSVHERLQKLGVEDQDRWTEPQLKLLKDAYSVNPDAPVNLAELATWIGKTDQNVCRKARELGLTSAHRKKSEKVCQEMGERTKRHWAEHGHPKGASKGGPVFKVCPRCGIFFPTYPSSRQVYCGMQCGHNHTQAQKNQGYAKSGKRADLNGQYFRSRWEANYARYLNFLKEHGEPIQGWEFESETFEFKGIKKGTRFYTPDFKVRFLDGHIEFHEVKGWDYPKGRTARKRFARYYPQHKLVLIDREFFRGICAQGIDSLIPNWEKETRQPPRIEIEVEPINKV